MPSSKLHIPRAPARPGEAPDFSYLKLVPAGKQGKPPLDIEGKNTFELAHGLVRVLDDQHRAVGPWFAPLEAAKLREGLRLMQLTRLFDDRMQRMHRQGRISFYMKCTGEEAVSVAQGMALAPDDMLFPSYRNQALHLVRGRNLVDLMNQCLSNVRDTSKGRQLPVLYHWLQGNIFTLSGNLATQFPQAVGWAMGEAIKGGQRLAVTWLGDGATAEADFHYALTFAAVYRAQVILNVVNNQWAISTFQTTAGGEQLSFAARGPGYGMAGVRVDGNDFLAVYAVTEWAAERARRGMGPTLIEHVTYRAGPHSTSDDPTRYRPKNDWEAWPLGDPLERLKQHLIVSGEWSEAQDEAQRKELEAYVTKCWKEAVSYGSLDEGSGIDPATMFEDVLEEMTPLLQQQRAKWRAERS
jgi:2-oxoisovalerate dehydrogenase E1 component alpha subunit